MDLVSCEVKGVFVTSGDTTVPLVILTDNGDRRLPIFIGLWEAVSINSAKKREVLSRPFTHDLFLDLAAKFAITFSSLQIDSMIDGVYYAQLVLRDETKEEFLDCRPSDGIALALRANVPIFVEESVLELSGQGAGDLPAVVDLETFLRK